MNFGSMAVTAAAVFSLLLGNGSSEAPPASQRAQKDPFLFIVYGDTRSRHDVHRRVVERVRAENPDFILHTGDMVANGNNPADWDRFFEIEKPLLRDVPFYPTLGNHERNAPAYFKYFVFPNGDGHHYSFDWGSAHFAVIDSNQVGQNRQEKEAFFQNELDWLREDLRSSTKSLKFVMFHHPLYTVIGRRKGSAAKLARQIEPVLAEGHVAAVFSGHDHNYQHHVHDGIHYIVAGGGGAPLYGVNMDSETVVKTAKVENYIRVRVDAGTAHVEAVDLDGNIIDFFYLRGRPGPAITASVRAPDAVRNACMIDPQDPNHPNQFPALHSIAEMR
jgi:predicted phosphodiesterase